MIEYIILVFRFSASITTEPIYHIPSSEETEHRRLLRLSEVAIMSQTRKWCFTLNNWTDAEVGILRSLQVVYLVFGFEVGDSGTPHLQGYIVFEKNQRLSAVKKILERAHWEPSRGSSSQAADYCKKDGKFEEFGTLPKSAGEAGGEAQRERYKRAWEAAKGGDMDAVPEDIRIRHYRTLKEIRKDYMAKPVDADGVTGVWIYGPAGVGKSRSAREQFPGAYFKMQNKWWDGYQNEEFVILDDFDCKDLGHLLKIWADRYSFLAETKGGAIHIRPKKFVVTSNYSLKDFGWDSEMVSALERRFTVIDLTPQTDVAPEPPLFSNGVFNGLVYK